MSDAFVGFDGQRIAFYMGGMTRCLDATTGQELWRSFEMLSPKWVGNGLYSVKDVTDLARWA